MQCHIHSVGFWGKWKTVSTLNAGPPRKFSVTAASDIWSWRSPTLASSSPAPVSISSSLVATAMIVAPANAVVQYLLPHIYKQCDHIDKQNKHPPWRGTQSVTSFSLQVRNCNARDLWQEGENASIEEWKPGEAAATSSSELYLDFFPAIVARMLRSASNNAVAESPSSTRRDKAKERSNSEFGRETHLYVIPSPNQSTIPRALWSCNTQAGQQRDNLNGVENLLRSFFVFPLSLSLSLCTIS